MRQDPRVLGAILINCHATAAGFLESRRDKVPLRQPLRSRSYHSRLA